MNSRHFLALASPCFSEAKLRVADVCVIVAVCCLMLLSHPVVAVADELDAWNSAEGKAPFEQLFNGRDFLGWTHVGNWRIVDKAFFCHRVDDGHTCDNNLHYDARRLPGDCELAFEWRESGDSKDTKRLSPGLGINYNIGIPGGGSTFGYGAGVEYHVSGVDIRLHTRNTQDTSTVNHKFESGFLTTWPVKDFSKHIGEWNQSRILCRGSEIQFWLNGKQAFDLDLEVVRAKGGRDRVTDMAIDDWIRCKNAGLYLSIIAPYSNELAAPRVQIRSITVRQLKAMEPHQAQARTALDY